MLFRRDHPICDRAGDLPLYDLIAKARLSGQELITPGHDEQYKRYFTLRSN